MATYRCFASRSSTYVTMASSRTHVLTSLRVRYGRSSGMIRSGASARSICVPSSLELDTSARLTPALRRMATASLGGTTLHASWL